MLITLLATYYFPTGAATEDQSVHLASSLPELARFLAKRGHRVRVVARKTLHTPAHEAAHGVEIFRVPVLDVPGLRLLSWHWRAKRELRKLEQQSRSDLVLCWDWSAALPALAAAHVNRSRSRPRPAPPVVCSLRNSSEAWRHLGSWRFHLYRWLEHRAYARSAFLISSSQWALQTLRSVMYLDTPTAVLHHGIDTEQFSPSVPARTGLRPPVIGFFGRLDRAKGVDLLLSAFAQLPEGSLLLVGDGPERTALAEQAEQLRISDRVRFAGFRPRSAIPAHMAACDVICLPSRTEGFSSVLVEALAVGKPVVATAVGGAPELVNRRNGMLVPPDDVPALAAALRKLLAPAARASMGKEARKTAEQLSWPVLVEQWEQLLETIARKAQKEKQ